MSQQFRTVPKDRASYLRTMVEMVRTEDPRLSLVAIDESYVLSRTQHAIIEMDLHLSDILPENKSLKGTTLKEVLDCVFKREKLRA